MRRQLLLRAVATVSIVIFASATMVQAANQYVIVGAGSRPCGSWLQLRSQSNPDTAVLQSWVLGYLTSVNANVLTVSQDVADGATPDALFSWIDDYCAAHPLDSLARATGSLLESLRAKNHAH